MRHLVRVEAPHFVAELVVDKRKVIEATPILQWALGKKEYHCNRYFESKKWMVNYIPLPEQET